MNNYLILIPTSEEKNIEGNDLFKPKNPYTINLLREIQQFLKNSSNEEIEKFFQVKDFLKYKNLMLNIENEKTLNAINRFNGVMYKAINYDNMKENIKNNFDKNIRIIDPLFGLLVPKTQIPNYKLKIDSKIGNIKINQKLKNIDYTEFKDKIIIDLLPKSYRDVIDTSKAKEVYKINFYKKNLNGKILNTGHFSKHAKGELINYLCNFENLNLDILKKFVHSEGFIYSDEYSKNNEIIYLKN